MTTCLTSPEIWKTCYNLSVFRPTCPPPPPLSLNTPMTYTANDSLYICGILFFKENNCEYTVLTNNTMFIQEIILINKVNYYLTLIFMTTLTLFYINSSHKLTLYQCSL